MASIIFNLKELQLPSFAHLMEVRFGLAALQTLKHHSALVAFADYAWVFLQRDFAGVAHSRRLEQVGAQAAGVLQGIQ